MFAGLEWREIEYFAARLGAALRDPSQEQIEQVVAMFAIVLSVNGARWAMRWPVKAIKWGGVVAWQHTGGALWARLWAKPGELAQAVLDALAQPDVKPYGGWGVEFTGGRVVPTGRKDYDPSIQFHKDELQPLMSPRDVSRVMVLARKVRARLDREKAAQEKAAEQAAADGRRKAAAEKAALLAATLRQAIGPAEEVRRAAPPDPATTAPRVISVNHDDCSQTVSRTVLPGHSGRRNLDGGTCHTPVK